MAHTLSPLPYSLDALEPYMSRETLEYHHGKHHQAYITNLNNLSAGTPYESMTLEELIKTAEGPILNNAAQVWNHTFFFDELSPRPQLIPEGELARAIDRDFGSLASFKEAFTKASTTLFGSGWTWLVCDNNKKLSIVSTSNAANPIRDGFTPLMCFDVWEHAYYIDYRNRRAEYINAFYHILDWRVVDKRFNSAK